MKSSRVAGALWILLSAVVFAGCGGGGGGHIAGSNDGNGGGGGAGGGGGGGDLGGLTGVEFTEDTSLDSDLSGNWIMISVVDDEPTTSAIPTTFTGTKRQSFFLNQLSPSSVSIESCVGTNNIVVTDTTVSFEFNNANYELNRDSNTHLSGTSESAVDGSRLGEITMIKTGERSDILGLFTYTVDGESADPFGVVCYSDRHGIETATQDGRAGNTEVESFEMANFSSTSIGSVSVNRHVGEDFYTLDVITSSLTFTADISDEGSVIEVDISGSNDISLEINAVDGASDGSTFEGSTELEI